MLVLSGFTNLYADDSGMDDRKRDRSRMMGTDSMMMQGRQMSESMTQRVNQMVDIMQRMSILIGKGNGTSNRKELTDVMKGMSAHMKEMYQIMKKGKVSQKDMEMLQQRMTDTEKRLNMVR
jgi:hypothetical protein